VTGIGGLGIRSPASCRPEESTRDSSDRTNPKANTRSTLGVSTKIRSTVCLTVPVQPGTGGTAHRSRKNCHRDEMLA
jgi:hypothetical protein